MGERRKSSCSGANGGSCVEVATAGRLLVRDTSNRDGGTLTLSADAWRTFSGDLKTALWGHHTATYTTHNGPS